MGWNWDSEGTVDKTCLRWIRLAVYLILWFSNSTKSTWRWTLRMSMSSVSGLLPFNLMNLSILRVRWVFTRLEQNVVSFAGLSETQEQNISVKLIVYTVPGDYVISFFKYIKFSTGYWNKISPAIAVCI